MFCLHRSFASQEEDLPQEFTTVPIMAFYIAPQAKAKLALEILHGTNLQTANVVLFIVVTKSSQQVS